MNRAIRPADEPSPAITVHSEQKNAISTWAIALLAVAAFFMLIHLAERDADFASSMAQANAELDAADASLQRAAQALCHAELGPGAQVLWTADGDLVCRPAVVVAEVER